MKNAKTAAERRYHERVAEIPCVLCELLDAPPGDTTLHHVREGQGMGQRSSHWLVVPLCQSCHQSRDGIHGTRTLLRIAGVEEMDLLALTIERLFGRAA